MATEPSWVAERDEREPRKSPRGVLATPTIHTSRGLIEDEEGFEASGAMGESEKDAPQIQKLTFVKSNSLPTEVHLLDLFPLCFAEKPTQICLCF